jgi:hypothetical protein
MLSTIQVLAYFSPETMLPLSSLIATIVGFALLIKRSSIRFVVHCCRAAFRGRPTGSNINKPHFATQSGETKQEARS